MERYHRPQEGLVTYSLMDDIQPKEPQEQTIEFYACFDKCNREKDYRKVRTFYERTQAMGLRGFS
jgi:hypothetical protein